MGVSLAFVSCHLSTFVPSSAQSTSPTWFLHTFSRHRTYTLIPANDSKQWSKSEAGTHASNVKVAAEDLLWKEVPRKIYLTEIILMLLYILSPSEPRSVNTLFGEQVLIFARDAKL